MKILILILLTMTMYGCGNVSPPSDELVKHVADSCEKKGMIVDVYYNGMSTKVECKLPTK